jgi:hypothetical protein
MPFPRPIQWYHSHEVLIWDMDFFEWIEVVENTSTWIFSATVHFPIPKVWTLWAIFLIKLLPGYILKVIFCYEVMYGVNEQHHKQIIGQVLLHLNINPAESIYFPFTGKQFLQLCPQFSP